MTEPKAFPTLIRGGTWEHTDVHFSKSAVTFTPKQQLFTSYDNDAYSRLARRHEAYHLKWSPKRKPKGYKECQPGALQLAEDWRIHALAKSYDLEEHGDTHAATAIEILAPVTKLTLPIGIIVGYGLIVAAMRSSWSQQSTVAKAIEDICSQAYQEATKEEKRIFGQRVADKLGTPVFNHDPIVPAPNIPTEYLPLDMPMSSVTLAKWLCQEPPKETGKHFEYEEDEEGQQGEIPEEEDDSDEWGPMLVDEPPLSVEVTHPRIRGTMYAQEGVVPTAWHRYPMDGSVFKRRAKRYWELVILIDASGSMSWDADNLYQATKAGALVAMYGGRAESGLLAIVSRDGMAIHPEYVNNWNLLHNVVDGPALQWLAQQDSDKKIWLSDGCVTGKQHKHTPRFAAECMRICRRAGIIRVGTHHALRRLDG